MNVGDHATFPTYRWARGNHGRRRFWRANCTCGWHTPHIYRRAAAEAAGLDHHVTATTTA